MIKLKKIHSNINEVLKKHNEGYQNQIPHLLVEIKKYYREYITMDSRVRLLEEDTEILKDEIRNIKDEIRILKYKKNVPLHKSLIDLWDNDEDEIWNDY